jgi:WD40 repeat protein
MSVEASAPKATSPPNDPSDLPPPPPRWRSLLPAWIRGLIWVEEGQSFDAFLSYSWAADSKVAPIIQSVLQQFLCPWFKPRARRIFRDLSYLPASASLSESLEKRLDASKHLIVLATPEAAKSEGMAFEADYWFSEPRTGEVLVVVTSGEYKNWDQIRDHALPLPLRSRLIAPPIFINISKRRGDMLKAPVPAALRGQLTEDLHQLILKFYEGQNKDWGMLRGEERSQRRKAQALAWFASLVLLAAMSGAIWQAFVAHQQRDEALHQAELAFARQLAAQSELLRTQTPTALSTAVRLASESMVRDAAAETDQVLWRGLAVLPTLETEVQHGDGVGRVRYSPDGCCVLTASQDGSARMIEAASGHELGRVVHNAQIWDAAIDPLNKFVATASADGTARISRWGYGKTMFVLRHGKGVRRVLFSPDGRLLGTGSEDGTGRLWSVETGKEIARIKHTATVWDVAFSPNGRYFATGGRDNRVRVWDCEKARQIAQLKTRGMVWNVSFSVDGLLLAAADDKGVVSVWRTQDFKLATELYHGDEVLAAGFSPDGHALVTTSFDRTIRVWALSDLHEVRRMQGQESITSMAFSPDGKLVATGGRTAQVWELATGNQVAIMALDDTSYGVAFSPDSKHLATASDNKFLRVWKLPTGHRALVRTADRQSNRSVPVVTGGWAMADGSSGTCVVLGGPDGTATVFRASDGAILEQLKYRSPLSSVATTTDCKTVATGGEDGSVRIWSGGVPKQLQESSHRGPILSLQFSHDGKLLISASEDTTVKVWDVGTSEQRHVLHHASSVHAAFFLDPSGATALTIFPDGATLWNVSTETQVTSLGEIRNITSVSISRDGQLFTLGDHDGNVRIWDSHNGGLQKQFLTSKELWGLSLRADNRVVATAPLREREATLWEAATGKALIRLPHPANVSAVAFEPSGAFVATGAVDGSVRVWELSTQRAIVEYRGASNRSVMGLRFTSDGTRLIIGFDDGFSEIIPWRPQESVEIACSRLSAKVFTQEFRNYVKDQFAIRACD